MKNFETRKLYYGFPVIVLGYRDENYGYNVTTSSSSYTLGDMMVIGIFSQNNVTKQIKKYKEFTVHISDIENMYESENAGFLNNVNKLEKLGLDYTISEVIDAPIIKGYKLVIECIVEEVIEFKGYTNFISKIVGRKISSDLLNEKNQLDSSKLNPIIFMGDENLRVYRELDDNVINLGFFGEK